MRKTIYDIAKELNVAPSTVSKALNNKSGISEKMRQKIQQYAKDVRYYADWNASKLKTKRSFSIGVVYSEDLDIGLEHTFFSSILQSFKSYVEAHGYEITFVISNLGNREISYLDFCLHKNIDGVFIVTSLPGDPYLKELVNSDISCVTTDIYHENLFTVISDNVDGAKQAVRYLHQMGHTKIAHVSERHFFPAARERLEGFYEAMRELNLPVQDEHIIMCEYYAFEYGYEAGQRFLALDDRPTAVFVVADIIAMGFISALKEAGLNVPDDVSVIGFDDIPFAKHYEPKLTTISQNTTKLGEKAADHLLKQMNEKTGVRSGTEKVPVELIVRDSVKKC